MGNDAYRYHVFLSYKRARRENGRARDDDVEIWVKAYFEPELQRKLTNALDESAQIFYDSFEIRTGDEWQRTICTALRSSCCVVPVWSPLYFRSPWCVSEWCTFRRRGQGLVLPVTWQTQPRLPPAARAVQYRDFSQYTYTAPSFPQSPKYLDFEDVVKEFAGDVARAIQRAPPFDPAWQIVLPEARPDLQVLPLDDVPDRDEMLVKQELRVSRGHIALAAA